MTYLEGHKQVSLLRYDSKILTTIPVVDKSLKQETKERLQSIIKKFLEDPRW
jgi:hypothetical protein